MDFIKTLLSSPTVKARALKIIRGGSMAAGAWALTSSYVWLTTHVTSLSEVDAMSIASVISTAVAGLVLTVGSAIYSQFDVTLVSEKITVAAATGSVEAANDKQFRTEIIKYVGAPSGSPESVTQAVEILRRGQM